MLVAVMYGMAERCIVTLSLHFIRWSSGLFCVHRFLLSMATSFVSIVERAQYGEDFLFRYHRLKIYILRFPSSWNVTLKMKLLVVNICRNFLLCPLQISMPQSCHTVLFWKLWFTKFSSCLCYMWNLWWTKLLCGWHRNVRRFVSRQSFKTISLI